VSPRPVLGRKSTCVLIAVTGGLPLLGTLEYFSYMPRTGLELESINALSVALQRYPGTLLLVTHDHDVIDEVATRIWNFNHGRIEDFKEHTSSSWRSRSNWRRR